MLVPRRASSLALRYSADVGAPDSITCNYRRDVQMAERAGFRLGRSIPGPDVDRHCGAYGGTYAADARTHGLRSTRI